MHAPDDAERTRCRFDGVLPAASEAAVVRAWLGFDGDPPTSRQCWAMPPTPGLVFGIGLSAQSFRLGPIVGRLQAAWIAHEESGALDAAPFGFDRFAGGTLVPRGYKPMGA